MGDKTAIGRTLTVLVAHPFDGAMAVITEIFAQEALLEKGKRLEFRGPVKLEEKTLHHTETLILPIVDRIIQSLGLPLKNFVISISNIGVSATRGAGLNISGFSADLALFMAMISVNLQAGLRQDIVATGHIASLAGDVAPVLDIPAKAEAVAASGDITEFLFADFEKDRSITHLLPPKELFRAKESLFQYQNRIKLTAIENICDVIRVFLPEETIVQTALEQRFFDTKPKNMVSDDPVNQSVSFLLENNAKRFWNTTRDFLFGHKTVMAKILIKAFIDYHLDRKQYPKDFGEQLYRLAMSLPILARKLDDLFPLVSVDQCIALSQLATPSDHPDVQILFKLTSREEFIQKANANSQEEPSLAGVDSDGLILRKILFELSDAILTEKIGRPLDEARATYSMKTVRVKDASEFNQAITGFYIHLMGHTQSPETPVSWEAAASEVIDKTNKAFRNAGGYMAALAEAVTGANGGLRRIFDSLTDYEKVDRKEKYRTMILKEAIDAFDWEAKVKMSVHILKQYSRYLPETFRTLEPEQLAGQIEESILHIAEGERNFDRWIRTH